MSVNSLPSGEVAFVFTDIESSSRAWSLHEKEYPAALARHNALAEEECDRFGGSVVKNLGDGYFLAFPTVRSAAEFSISLQKRLIAEDFSAVDGLRVRIGFHNAEAEPQNGDYFGADVNLSQRVSDAGHGEMILCTESAANRLESDPLPETRISPMGRHRLKNLPDPTPIFRLVSSVLPDREYPQLRTLNALQHNFPSELTAFVGREAELDELNRLVTQESRRLITLTGPGGVGKSRIALKTALATLEAFPDGSYYIELAKARGVEDVPEIITAALSEEAGIDPSKDPAQQLRTYFRDKRALLLLENFEMVPEAAGFISDLVRDCPRLYVIATSRQLLQISGEREIVINPMEVPAVRAPFASIAATDSVRLFVERAANARAGFELTEDNAEPIASICRELDGLPLSIELTAALVRALTPAQIIPQLSRRFRLIAASRPDLEPRLRSLRGAIDWSYDLLNEEERGLFAELGVFAGPFTLDDTEAVCDSPDAFFALLGLRDKSLLRAEESGEETRYSMLGSLREYAREKLTADGRYPNLKDKHRRYYVEKSEAYSMQLDTDARKAMANFSHQMDNLNAGLEYAEAACDDDTAARYGASLGRYFNRRGPYSAADKLLEMAVRRERSLAAQDSGKHRNRLATALLRYGSLLQRKGDDAEASDAFSEALPIFESAGDERSRIACGLNLGTIAFNQFQLVRAKEEWEKALEIAQRNGNRFADTLEMNLAILEATRCDFESAHRYAEAALQKRNENDSESVAYSLLNSGEILASQFDSMTEAERGGSLDLLTLAEARLKESLKLCEEMGNRPAVDSVNYQLANVALLRDEFAEADRISDETLKSARENEDEERVFTCLLLRGQIESRMSQWSEAASHWKDAFEVAMQNNGSNRRRVAALLIRMGEALVEKGEQSAAAEAFAVVMREDAELGILSSSRVRAIAAESAPDSETPVSQAKAILERLSRAEAGSALV